jgi:hypothetical protein
MIIDRRSVLAGTALVAVAPTLSFASAALPTLEPRANPLVVKIDGWSEPGNTAEEVWIKVDRSWRTAWR